MIRTPPPGSGSKKLGEMTDLVSQFEVQENYTQINYKGTPYRVTPLRYADPIKWLYNQKKGLRHTLLSIWSIRIPISSGCPPA